MTAAYEAAIELVLLRNRQDPLRRRPAIRLRPRKKWLELQRPALLLNA